MVERIKELCHRNGITVAALEAALGFGNGSIRKWDSNSPSLDKVKKVAVFFGISVSDLIGEDQTEDENLNELLDMVRTRSEVRMLLMTAENATRGEVEENIRIIEAIRKAKDDIN